MSSRKPSILTESDLKNEAGAKMMKLFLKDGGVPSYILDQMDAGPALDQFYHLITSHKMGWRDAIVWVNDHRAEIMEHDRKLNENPAPAPSTD